MSNDNGLINAIPNMFIPSFLYLSGKYQMILK